MPGQTTHPQIHSRTGRDWLDSKCMHLHTLGDCYFQYLLVEPCAGPTGRILAQLLKLNSAHRVIIAANKGIKMDIAKQLGAADEYIELDRQNPGPQWEQLKKDNPYGFDVVVEATGVEKLANDSINYVRRGGTLVCYGVYANSARVTWPPSKIFGDG